MGTRALVHVHESSVDQAPILTIYRQFDGYPDGLGQEIADAFGQHRLVNGISPDMDESRIANRMGCLAAQIVSALKKRVGNVEIMTPGISDVGEEYVYRVYANEPNGEGFDWSPGPIKFRCDGYGETLFDGLLSEFDADSLHSEDA